MIECHEPISKKKRKENLYMYEECLRCLHHRTQGGTCTEEHPNCLHFKQNTKEKEINPKIKKQQFNLK